MANLLTNTSELTSIADAIRSKTGKTSSISFPSGFVSEIGNISGGGGGTLETASVTIDMSVISGEEFVFYISGTQLDGDGLTIFGDQIDDTNLTTTFDAVVGTNVTILSIEPPTNWYCIPDGGNIEDMMYDNSNHYVGLVNGTDTIYIEEYGL